MKIQIDGTNTQNKGAELMLYGVLEEIKIKFPNALVTYNPNSLNNRVPIETSLKFTERFFLKYARYIIAVFRRLKLPITYFTPWFMDKPTNILLDAGGFQFSDQWNHSEDYLKTLKKYYKKHKAQGAKIVLLPQAFGPFETRSGKNVVKIIDEYVDIIIAREDISYKYLLSGGANKNKLLCYPDFTVRVNGAFPERYNDLKGKVCIIPNRKMLTHTKSGSNQYIEFIKMFCLEMEQKGKDIFILNHEGKRDLELCEKINTTFNNKYTIATGLNAKEVKGLIGASYMVLSSRYHGVASALSQGVPCLATSWSHKYNKLFEDYELTDMVLDVEISEKEISKKVQTFFNREQEIRNQLTVKKEHLYNLTTEMWDSVWQKLGHN